MTLEAKNPLMRWGFLGLWLVSGLILVARWRWEQEHPEQRSPLDFQFMWKYLAFMVIWTGLLLLVDSFYSGGQRSDLRVPLVGLLLGSLIWLVQSWHRRPTQGP
ncbi:hypothetical protein FNU79_12605 [Deinococcus detaillensis]|uniref:Uncharacterized protein n=1 Tax=Deinococcus detaillensis TaxID=2592048 RepID=A0A553USH0_9DEIO|nr:hypothetical protein [Deinococcus detaillensis]TSA83160.1 hypothetical protein FNU79_12605 [Deinococcus detaillensis]